MHRHLFCGVTIIPITLAAGIIGFGVIAYKDAQLKGAKNAV